MTFVTGLTKFTEGMRPNTRLARLPSGAGGSRAATSSLSIYTHGQSNCHKERRKTGRIEKQCRRQRRGDADAMIGSPSPRRRSCPILGSARWHGPHGSTIVNPRDTASGGRAERRRTPQGAVASSCKGEPLRFPDEQAAQEDQRLRLLRFPGEQASQKDQRRRLCDFPAK